MARFTVDIPDALIQQARIAWDAVQAERPEEEERTPWEFTAAQVRAAASESLAQVIMVHFNNSRRVQLEQDASQRRAEIDRMVRR